MHEGENNIEVEEATVSYSFSEVIRHLKWAAHYCKQLDPSFGLAYYIFSLLSNVKGIISIAIFGFTIDAIVGFSTQGFNSTSAWTAFSLYAFYNIGENLLETYEQSFVTKRKNILETQLKRSFLHKLLRTDIRNLDKKITNEDLSAKYTSSTSLFTYYTGSIGFASDVTICTILLLIIAYFAWPLALALILLSIPRFWLDKMMRKRYSVAQIKSKKVAGRLRGLIRMWLDKNYLHKIETQRIGILFDKKFIAFQDSYQKSINSTRRQWHATNKALDIANSLASLIGYAWVLFKNSSLVAVGSIYTQLRLINMLEAKLKKIVTGYNALEESCTKIVEIQNVYLWKEKERAETEPEESTTSIELKQVSFVRPDLQTPMIDNLRILFKAGERTDVIATDPTTKELLMRFLTLQTIPTSGEVLVNNKTANTLPADVMCVLSGFSYFSFLSIAENITLSTELVDEEKLIKVMKLTGIHDVIMNMPNKFMQIISELPAPMPLSFSSRILAARVLFQEPKWVVWLSGKESGPKTECDIFKLLYEFIPSVITITDKVSSSVTADRIVLIRQGKVIEQGEREILIQHKGEYAKWLEKIIGQQNART
jgi:ABC-type multidrug transport system fused ATPase/permease subunit